MQTFSIIQANVMSRNRSVMTLFASCCMVAKKFVNLKVTGKTV